MQRYLVTYDICDPKRLREVFKALEGFGVHLQLSVFQCDMTATRFAQLRKVLGAIINLTEDQVLIIDLGPTEGRAREVVTALGKPYVFRDDGPVIA